MAQGLELVNGSRALQVGGNQHGPLALALEVLGQLGRRRRLPGALQARHQDHEWRRRRARQRDGLVTKGDDEFLVDDLDDLLAGRQALHDVATDGALLHPGQEGLHHRNVDIGFEQRQTDFAQGSVDVGLAETAFAAQTSEDVAEAIGESVEHRAEV